MARYDEGKLEFLKSGFVREQCAVLKMGPDVTEGIVDGLKLFDGAPVQTKS